MHLESTYPNAGEIWTSKNVYRVPSQICCDIAKLTFFQLRLPEDRIGILSGRSVQS